MSVGRELGDGVDHLEESVYCVDCGTIFVWERHRDCPTCANREAIDDLQERVDRLENENAELIDRVEELEGILDEYLDDFLEVLDTIETKTNLLVEVQEAAADEEVEG